jgi:transcriptional regulator with XRE-family HTH domain
MKKYYTYEKNELAERLRELRKSARLTMIEAARLADISFSHLSKIETGTGNLGEGALQNLATLYRVNRDWLISGKGDRTELQPAQSVVREEPMDYPAPTPTSPMSRIIQLSCDDRIKTAAEGVASALGCSYPEALEIVIQRELGKVEQK